MRIVISAFAVLLALSPSPLLASASPERTKGISMHMLPKQVADLSGGKLRWGLNVDYADYLKGETVQPIVQSTAEFQTYVQKQTPAVQSNGVWIVLTNPMAYSASETAMLEQIKALCRKDKIPLFIARAMDLPNGWKRFDDAP